ncbi:MAG: hypothetical protein K2M10_05860 [Muribaculaceae bacterium]|nr:hypothetical protein [Muribaculaceae bacterium]
MRRIKVIHVHLIGKRRDYYFGSISAIFTTLKSDDIGLSLNYLLHAGLSGGGSIITDKAIIKQSYLITCPRNNER